MSVDYELSEVKAVPPATRASVYKDKYLPIIEAAIASDTGIVAADFKEVKAAQRAANTIVHFINTHGLKGVIRVQQRKGVVFVTDLSRAGTDRDPFKGNRA